MSVDAPETSPSSLSPARAADKPLLKALLGEALSSPPIWMMRQAGRYLPEYRALRAEAGSFLNLCYDPPKAAEVTLQPLRRFAFDAAILFSDILVIPQALGQDLTFVTGEGPRLTPWTPARPVPALDEAALHKVLGPVYETVARVSEALDGSSDLPLRYLRSEEPDTPSGSSDFPPSINRKAIGQTLIGFAGAPWTVATYMVNGRGSKTDHSETLAVARANGDWFDSLIALLVDATVAYLDRQVRAGLPSGSRKAIGQINPPSSTEATGQINPSSSSATRDRTKNIIPPTGKPEGGGAEVIKLFDSWAGSLIDKDERRRWSVGPLLEIARRMKALHPSVPVMLFPRGVGASLTEYQSPHVDGLAVGQHDDLTWAVENIDRRTCLQGNLDPQLLIEGGTALDAGIDRILEVTAGRAHIFNLGHGITPPTPVENVARMVARVKNYRS